MPPGDVLVEGGEQVEERQADDHVVIHRDQTRYEEHTPAYTCRKKIIKVYLETSGPCVESLIN